MCVRRRVRPHCRSPPHPPTHPPSHPSSCPLPFPSQLRAAPAPEGGDRGDHNVQPKVGASGGNGNQVILNAARSALLCTVLSGPALAATFPSPNKEGCRATTVPPPSPPNRLRTFLPCSYLTSDVTEQGLLAVPCISGQLLQIFMGAAFAPSLARWVTRREEKEKVEAEAAAAAGNEDAQDGGEAEAGTGGKLDSASSSGGKADADGGGGDIELGAVALGADPPAPPAEPPIAELPDERR